MVNQKPEQEEPLGVAFEPPAPSPAPPPVPAMAPQPPVPHATVREIETSEYVKVPVFFATTRKAEGGNPLEMFGANRDKTKFGVSWVSIPRSHEAGELEEPSILTLTFHEDPAKHVVLLAVNVTPKERWYQDLNASIADGGLHQAFVFIHGYNVSFADASRRTAQIKYDLGFAGPAILFSWPSYGQTAKYLADEANAEWSAPQLAELLVELRKRTGATTIHLIAHSLGNRVLSRAMERIDLDPKIAPKPLFSQVVLAAPDMDADVFREQLAPRMLRLARGITLYGSSDDRAILASKKAHLISRAGEGGANLPIIPGIDSIDVTGMDTSFLAHSYIGAVSVLGDVAQLFCEGKKSANRFGLVQRAPAGWQMVTSQEKRSARPCLATPPG
jgi:esterase/lipase superfamily enzyme